MGTFQCAYCTYEFDKFTTCIAHSIDVHSEEVLRVIQCELDPTTGLFRKKKLNYSVIPCDVTRGGNIIVPIEKTLEVYLNTTVSCQPAKQATVEGSATRSEENSNTDLKQNEELDKFEKCLERFQSQSPAVLERLHDCGHLQTFLELWDLIADNAFPFDNIAFRLFMDVVSWYSKRNTSQMRYSDITKMFWRTGYKLFRGKFLNFMGGFKNLGDILTARCTRGTYAPCQSKVNFAVPSHTVLQKQTTFTLSLQNQSNLGCWKVC